ncbi:MAG: bifunctional alpha/beta hydrolase/class I SAM-dependent methyltransferase [Flavobacteriaceae bacterium]|jgi:alpha-beta hydrolase superfamily lysophospholipase|nr:bifunctional alpha/beta hydrolase/class I SAM-dependent methyltransferase [Flavobacteriaceae bacterium]
MKTGTFLSFDNAEIFYRAWNYVPSQKTIIILHRGHEHSERMSEFATDSRFAGYNIFSYDLRGHGYTKQTVSAVFMDYVRDLDAFTTYLKDKYEIKTQDIFIVANSMTSVVASAWVHDFAPDIAGMALLAPAFSIKLYVPFAKQFVALSAKLSPKFEVKSYVKSKMLTHDVDQQKAYDSDPLITKSINGAMLVDFLDSGKRIVEDAAAIKIPTIVFSSGKDYVVQNDAQKKFFIRIESEYKEFIEMKDSYHGLLFEKDHSLVYDHIKRFMEKSFNNETPPINLGSDKFTRDEYYTLSLKQIPSIDRINFAVQKWMLGKIGFLSNGMKIGLKYGFDSGISLDYVYQNKPKGKSGIGKMMDYFYLNAIGWRGIRIRKKNLLVQLEQQIVRLQQENRHVRILDIAGGTGNYLFDIKKKYPDVEIVVNDLKESNIEFGQKRIVESGIKGMRFTNYDCFDPETYKKLGFSPNITIISGIFELFEDNQMVSNAISGAVSISEPNSSIIYTGQPWHPQLKMIAYVLNSHQGKDWVMRRRSQNELDRVFAFNGVRKESMLIDDYGIFTISCGKVK